ncbi:MAG: hypothetical protein NZM12_01055, partial [Steroidobacteraceae bacterium]|nr:hypothetical protein [Steroidobacteraceae bacterium]MDW8259380.1 hypothetical protein [Gammaproteobacteria bacterium]
MSKEWDQIVSAHGYPPFLQAAFLLRAIQVFPCPRGLLMLGRRDGTLRVGAIVVPAGLGRWATYQPAQLPLGACILASGLNWTNVLPQMAAVLPGPALQLSVMQQDPQFVRRPVDTGCICSFDYVPTAWIDVRGSYADFWQARGKNLRQNLPKQRRKIEKQIGQLAFEYVSDQREIIVAFEQFAALESEGWKSTNGTAVSVDNLQGNFYRAVL